MRPKAGNEAGADGAESDSRQSEKPEEQVHERYAATALEQEGPAGGFVVVRGAIQAKRQVAPSGHQNRNREKDGQERSAEHPRTCPDSDKAGVYGDVSAHQRETDPQIDGDDFAIYRPRPRSVPGRIKVAKPSV